MKVLKDGEDFISTLQNALEKAKNLKTSISIDSETDSGPLRNHGYIGFSRFTTRLQPHRIRIAVE
jgi:hypothetical protein